MTPRDIPKLNPIENKVLAFLATGGEDFGFFSFSTISEYVREKRAAVRRACRSLKRKGLAKFGMGLWTDDGGPAGSGYAATAEGKARADSKLVERYELRRWP